MGKEVLSNSPSEPSLDELFQRLNDRSLGIRGQERLTNLIAGAATTDTYDCVSALDVIAPVTKFVVDARRRKQNVQLGIDILSRIEGYFNEQKVNFKYLAQINDPKSLSKSILKGKGIVNDLQQIDKYGMQRFPQILGMLHGMARHSVDSLESEKVVIAINALSEDTPEEDIALLTNQFTFVLEKVDDNRSKGPNSPEDLPGILLQHARKYSEASRLGPNLYNDEFADTLDSNEKVSLKMLDTCHDQEEFNRLAMTYISGVPRGNVLWQKFVDGLFFTIQRRKFSDKTPRKFVEIDFAKRVSEFQMCMSENLLGGVFREDIETADFDKRFVKMLDALSPETIDMLVAPTMTIIGSRAFIAHSFGEIDLHDFSEEDKLGDDFKKFLMSYPRALRGSIHDLELPRIIVKNWEKVSDSLKVRLGKNKKTQHFMDGMLENFKSFLVEHEKQDQHISIYLQKVAKRNERLWKPLDVKRVKEDGGFIDTLGEEYKWSEGKDTFGDEVLQVEFPMGSQPELMGFAGLRIYKMDPDKSVVFQLVIGRMDDSVIGTVDKDGFFEVNGFYQRDQDTTMMLEFMSAIVLSSMRDLYTSGLLRKFDIFDPKNLKKEDDGLSDEMIEEVIKGYLLSGGELTYEAISQKNQKFADLIRERRMLSKLRRKFGVDKARDKNLVATDELLDDLLERLE